MADFMESAKHFVSAAVSRTSWEAQKQLRLRSKQSEIDKLLDQRHQLLEDLSKVALNLHQQGALTNPQLSRVCAGILELDSDVKEREAQLQDLKKETYPADQFAPTPTTNYAPPSPTAPPTSAGPRPGSTVNPQPLTCPTCGNTVRANALYCRSCGTKMR
jgi:hypothetical protein